MNKAIYATGLLSALSVNMAEASVSFTSQAAIGFEAIGLNPAVNATGSFAPGIGNVYAQDNEGNPLDASHYSITASNSAVALNLGDSNSFIVSGYADTGSVESHQSGSYQFAFLNTGAALTQVQLRLNYSFLTTALGEFSDSDFKLDFWQPGAEADSQTSLGFVASSNGFLLAEAYAAGVQVIEDQSGFLYNFDLAGAGSQSVYADLTVVNNLQPVPLPAAVWFFVSGIGGLLGLSKRAKAVA
jgi:hypothetical protein